MDDKWQSKTVSNNFLSMLVDSINVLDCRIEDQLFACWQISHELLSSADFFSKNNSFKITIRLSNSLDPDQA